MKNIKIIKLVSIILALSITLTFIFTTYIIVKKVKSHNLTNNVVNLGQPLGSKIKSFLIKNDSIYILINNIDLTEKIIVVEKSGDISSVINLNNAEQNDE